jgi:hypothetical protein
LWTFEFTNVFYFKYFFYHFLVGWLCRHGLPLTFRSYPKVAISKHFTVNQAQTLIEVQSLI